MPVNLDALIGGVRETHKATFDDVQSMLRVALPGIIQSYNPETVTAAIQIAIMGEDITSDGVATSDPIPLLIDVPVLFPRGGGFSITFPVTEGDECLVVFADRCIDFWWQSGGVQEAVDPRMHDLSDGFAILAPQSQTKKLSGISANSVQIRTDDGSAFLEIDQSGNINATTPQLTVNGNVQFNGNLSISGDVNIDGSVTSSGDQTAGGISQTGHVHPGVQTGSGTTGAPQ